MEEEDGALGGVEGTCAGIVQLYFSVLAEGGGRGGEGNETCLDGGQREGWSWSWGRHGGWWWWWWWKRKEEEKEQEGKAGDRWGEREREMKDTSPGSEQAMPSRQTQTETQDRARAEQSNSLDSL